MQIIETKGNKDLMNREKTLFLCSKLTPISFYEYIFQWVDGLTINDCVACFNSTEMESEVLKALLVAKIPAVLFVMNRFTDVNNIQIIQALEEKRLLIVILRRDEQKGKGATPRLRNEFVLSICQHLVCGYVNPNGSVFSLLAGRKEVVRLIDDNACINAVEQEVRHERWTVAQDKVLLRMYYSDMGIHAIHQRLQRSYVSVYTRIRSITQPEEVLKGREFEDFVLGLFNIHENKELVLQEWQGDKSLGSIMPENNSNPDFVFRLGDKVFAVECKWREKLERDLEKDLFSNKRINPYWIFSRQRKVPVTVFWGVGGEPCNPDSLYIIPLESVESVVSGTKSILEFRNKTLSLDINQFVKSIGNYSALQLV